MSWWEAGPENAVAAKQDVRHQYDVCINFSKKEALGYSGRNTIFFSLNILV